MTPVEFYNAYAEEYGIPKKQARMIIRSVFRFLAKAITKEDEITIFDFGKFARKSFKAKRYRNMFTGNIEQGKPTWRIVLVPFKTLALDENGVPLHNFDEDDPNDIYEDNDE